MDEPDPTPTPTPVEGTDTVVLDLLERIAHTQDLQLFAFWALGVLLALVLGLLAVRLVR